MRSQISLRVFLISLLFLGPCAIGDTLATLLQRGDSAYRNRGNALHAKEALEYYRRGALLNSNSVEAHWRLSMACHFWGMRRSPEIEKKAFFIEGRKAGNKSLELSPNCAPCHFWTAVNTALHGEQIGVFKALSTLKEVEHHLHETIKWEPGYAYGGAYRILGVIQQKLPGILGGSNDDAKKLFESAIQNAPKDPLNFLFLTRLLLNELDDKESAIQIAQRGLSYPSPDSELLESVEARKELQTLLSTLIQHTES